MERRDSREFNEECALEDEPALLVLLRLFVGVFLEASKREHRARALRPISHVFPPDSMIASRAKNVPDDVEAGGQLSLLFLPLRHVDDGLEEVRPPRLAIERLFDKHGVSTSLSNERKTHLGNDFVSC